MPIAFIAVRRRLVECDCERQPVLAEPLLRPGFAHLDHLLRGPAVIHGEHGGVEDLRALLCGAIDLLQVIETADHLLDRRSDVAPEYRRSIGIERRSVPDVLGVPHSDARLCRAARVVFDI
ncbi:MAG: hypothetical protein V2J51_06825 [Erythrobacter sp.]|nr:hypothetical protein [Erythrobacter sp.]